MAEIEDALRGSHAFLSVLSPDWAESRTCIAEHAIAQRHAKRVVPVQCRALSPECLPNDLAKSNWIRCTAQDDFDTAVALVLEALDLDLEHVKMHTRLEQRAAEWTARKNDASLTLRGADLDEAERWLTVAAGKDPSPTTLQRTFITDSRAAAVKRRRVLMVSVSVALTIAVGLGVAAWLQSQRANTREVERDREAQTALARKLRTIASDLSRDEPHQLPLAVLLSIEAVRRLPGPETEQTLSDLLAITIPRETATGREKPVWAAVVVGPGTVAVLNNAVGREVKRIEVPGKVRATAISAGGQLLATAGDTTTRIWNVSTGADVAQLAAGGDHLVFSDDETQLAIGGIEEAVVYEVQSGRELRRAQHFAKFGIDSAKVALNSAESLLATAVGDTVRLWSLEHPGQESHLELKHVGTTAVVFSPDGRRIASAGADRTARIWDVESGLEVARAVHDGPVTSLRFNADGTRLVTGSDDGTVVAWSLWNPWRQAIPLETFDFDCGFALSADAGTTAFPDGKDLVVRKTDGTEIARVPRAMTAALSANGGRLATADHDGTATVYELPTGRSLRRLKLDDQGLGLAVDGSGRYLAVAEFDHFAIWDTERRERIVRVEMRAPPCGSGGMALSAAHVAVAPLEGPVVIYELTTGKADQAVEGGGKSVALSADGRLLAVHREAGEVVVIDRQTRQTVATFAVEAAEEIRLAVTSDGARLAIATPKDGQGLLLVFDVASGKEMHRSMTRNQISALAMPPDGRSVLTSRDGAITLQRRLIDPALLAEAACARMSRGLSEAEWQQYLPGQIYAPACRK